MQPGARPPQGAGQAHRTSVLRNPTITVEPASQQAAPGVTTEIVLAIVNNSDTVSDFTVELDDRRIGWIRIEPATKNLWPGSRDVFKVLVTPPRSAEVRAGLKQLGLTITSSGIPGGVANATIQVVVLPFEEVEPRIVPKTSAGYFRGRHRIEVRNLGSAPWTARLSASDPEEALRISLPEQISVGPGDTAVVGVTVRAKGWNIIGSTQPHPFTVDLEGGEGTKQRLDANHNQRAVIPGRLIVPLLAALALIAVGGLWALGVIPPGGGATSSPSLPTPSEVAVTSGSPPPTEPPSEPPSESVPPSESAPPSEEPASPSESAAAKPEGVDQWAWDRYNQLLTQKNTFDVGKTIGVTQDTSDGRARVQWFDLAVMYQFQDGTVQVVRPPIFAAFPLQPISKDQPSTGYPLDQRRGAGQDLIYQMFETQGILCAGTQCVVYPKNVLQEWLNDKDRLALPLDQGTQRGQYWVYQFEQGHIVWDTVNFFVSACDANNVFISGDTDLCSV